MDDKKVKFLPFHVINEFMLPEYRHTVIQTVLTSMEQLSGPRRGTLNAMIRRYVSLPGFRNSSIAPTGLKIKGCITAFERQPDFAAHILQGWCELKPELAIQIYDLLKERGWETIPVEADRTKLPGFLTDWPEADKYEVLDKAFQEKYSDVTVHEYDERLMIVWISGRLPYNVTEPSDESEQDA